MLPIKILGFQVTVAILGVCSTVVNATGLILLIREPFKSFLTNFLFRALCISNIYAGFNIFLYQVLPIYATTESLAFNTFICKLWYREHLFWQGIAFGTLTMVAIAFDRFFAVLFPSAYKFHQKYILTGMLVVIGSVFALLIVPFFFRREFNNGRCTMQNKFSLGVRLNFLRAGGYIWLCLIYIIPITCFITTHGVVICVVRRQQLKASPEAPGSSEQGPSPTASSSDGHELRRLILSTLLMSANLVLCHSVATAAYIIQDTETMHQVGVTFLTLSNLTTPLIMVTTTTHLRQTVAKLLAQRKASITRPM